MSRRNNPSVKYILQDGQDQLFPEDPYAADDGIRQVRQAVRQAVDSTKYSPLPLFEGNGLSSEDDSDGWDLAFNDNDISSSATSTSFLTLENGNTNDASYEKHPMTLRSFIDAHWLNSKRQCSRREPALKNDVVSQPPNMSLGPEPRNDISTRFSSQESATFCIPKGLAYSYDVCATQEDAEGEVRVGWKGHATRWRRDSTLRYTVCTETFKSPQVAALVARETAKAILMWQNIGARFQKVDRNKKATFAIRYCFEPDNCRPDVYAKAFFPKTSPGELFVYQLALEPATVDFLANILAHEFGHILGLSHEFAVHTSFLWGKKNGQSVMNYFSDLSRLQVGQQDLEDLAKYYQCKEGQYEMISISDIEPRAMYDGYDLGRHDKLSIKDIEPQLYQFPRNDEYSTGHYRSTLRRLYLNYQVKRDRLRRSPSLIRKISK